MDLLMDVDVRRNIVTVIERNAAALEADCARAIELQDPRYFDRLCIFDAPGVPSAVGSLLPNG